jgi:hypothetical protein
VPLTRKEIEKLFRIKPNRRGRLKDYDPDWAARDEYEELTRDELKARAQEFLAKTLEELAEAQQRLLVRARQQLERER